MHNKWERGESHNFSWKNCCHMVPKDSVGEPFSNSKLSWCRKTFLRGAKITISSQGVARFPVDSSFGLTAPKVRREPIKISEKLGY